MEAKREAKSGADSKAGSGTGGTPANIVMKFSEFAFGVLNHDMDDFFEDNLGEFDQESEELTSGRGETLQQYEVYEKYVAELERRFDSFAADEGYDSVLDCFNAMNDIVIGDKLEREQFMRDMARRMREAQESWQNQLLGGGDDDAKAEGKNEGRSGVGGKSAGGYDDKGGDEEEDEDVKADSKTNEDNAIMKQDTPPPVVMFFQPISMESVLGMVLSMTEYTTFSTIMRAKVRQAKLLEIMQRRVRTQDEDAEARKQLLESGRRGDLVAVFEELVDRVCGLTPHQEALHAEVRAQLGVDDWRDMLASADDDSFPAKYKQVFKRLVMSVCMAIWNMVSPEAQMRVRIELCRFIPQVDTLESSAEVSAAAGGFLAIGHGFVDETERNMVEVLLAHSHHHRRRKQHGRVEDLDAEAK